MLHVCEHSVFEGAHACIHVCTCGGLRLMLLRGSPLGACIYTVSHWTWSWPFWLVCWAILFQRVLASITCLLRWQAGHHTHRPLGRSLGSEQKSFFLQDKLSHFLSWGSKSLPCFFSWMALNSLGCSYLGNTGRCLNVSFIPQPLLDISVNLPKDFYH